MMNEFRFAEPGWIHLLWGILLLAGVLIALEFRGRTALGKFLSGVMQSRLVTATSRTRRLTALAFLLLSLMGMNLAVMRPQWGSTTRNLPQVGAQIMVCLDVSKSMLAEDTVPNRLERAKAEVGDLLDLLQGEQVGLIAFAGKATVVSPMTSDFGFLKLMMANVGPHTIGMGGTRLEEPIRKAVDGFGEAADISRVILLITDGEDHDSFPMQAAELARERGIKIITIGFGDEIGSKIHVTDRRSGRRSFVTDSDGNAVISRLDGDMLRDIALKTDGAYIPAGTGALDLRSIHAQHIVPLMRGTLESSQQIIRNEAFQWFVLSSLLLLLLSFGIGNGAARLPASMTDGVYSSSTTQAAVLFVGVMLCVSNVDAQTRPLLAQAPGSNDATDDANSDAESAAKSVIEAVNDGRLSPELDSTNKTVTEDVERAEADFASEQKDQEDAERDPRGTYNTSLTLMSSDADRAERLLQLARRNAGTDGEVRYRSAYNLGWVEVNRADGLLQAEPKQALVHLQAAADWFRQAINIRPKNMEARHNLELVMRRALELADSLAKQDQGDIAAQLDQLVGRQRELIGTTGQLVERLAAEGAAPPDAEIYRRDFRGLATNERQILSDLQRLAEQVAEELDSITKMEKEELTQEQRVRGGQLQGVANYLARGTQRIGQARSQMRRRDDQRAFRRATRGLDELKRARDMLRPPNEILKRLVTDTKSLYAQTKVVADTSNSDDPQASARRPKWLTRELLVDSQQSLTERSAELTEQFKAVFSEENERPDMPAEEQQKFDRLKAAPEIMQSAVNAFEDAQTAIDENDFGLANERQTDAYRELNRALELFLDLKGLIEASHSTQKQIEKLLDSMPELNEQQQEAVREVAKNMQAQNLDRAERMSDEIEQQREALGQGEIGPQQPKPQATTEEPEESDEELRKAQERARLQTAADLLNTARNKMNDVTRQLDDANSSNAPPAKKDDLEGSKGEGEKVSEGETNESSTDDASEPGNDRGEGESSDGKNSDSESPTTNERHEASDEGELETQSETTETSETPAEAANEAAERLQDLRRLFFSVVEHLEETSQKQQNLNDQTQELAATPDSEQQQQKMGPLENEQRQLQAISEQIAEELRNQATQPAPPTADDSQASPEQQQQRQEAAEKMAQASDLVRQASRSMQQSRQAMRADSPELKEVREPQDEAAKKLKEALALLQPPQQQNNEQDQDQQQQEQPQNNQPEEQDQDQQQDEPQDSQDGQGESQQQDMSMAELLQMIRDRDAQRRRDKERRAAVGTLPVDKDW